MQIKTGISDLEKLLKGKFKNMIEFYSVGKRYMTERQRRRLEMRLSGMSVSDIAAKENVTPNAISKSLADAVRTVKKKIEKFNKAVQL